jgi:ATP-dependent exoDNAse (exonuclease V) beta subunit
VRPLTEEQQRAVDRRREPLLLAAGAGSGKTSVLVERFVRAVLDDRVAPGSILAITFTDRAAGELRERVRERFLELGEREAARDTEAAFVSTFHGFCARLLRTHALMAGLDPEFSILEEALAARARERAFAVALREFLAGERPAAVDLLAVYGADDVRAIVEGVHAELRSRGQRRPRLPPLEGRGEAEGVEACLLLDELLDRFGRSYESLKRRRGAVDFDDLELLARDLLDQRESVRAAWSERFELLMVDEFQDTNPRQLAILRALERENLFTVGDELQSIYGFRHADVSLFRARRAELAERGASLRLARNFRSVAPLLDVINAVFRQRLGAGYVPLVAGREEREDDVPDRAGEDREAPLVELLLTTTGGWDEDERERARAGGVAVWRQAEAKLLARRVVELVDGGEVRAGDVVVLLRAVSDLEVYERALQDAGLRTLAAVGGFWGRQQVGDLLAYLRALANPLDELALYSTLASPLVGLSSDGLALLSRIARSRGGSRRSWATIQDAGEELLARLPARDGQALMEFRRHFEEERRTAPRRTISQLLQRAVDFSGYRAHVLGLDWGERRLANVHKLLRMARRFEAGEGRDLRGFLDYATELQDATKVSEPDAPVTGVEPDAVRLMSIHAAKGLEFPVVCIADLGRAPRISTPSLLVDGDRVGLRLSHLDGAEPTSALDYEQLCEERRQAGAEEEERILYVAMTRARERLLLSGAVDFERWPEPKRTSAPISWLGPALVADLPAIVLGDLRSGEWPVRDLIAGAGGSASLRCTLNAPGTEALCGGGKTAAGEPSGAAAGADSVAESSVRDNAQRQLSLEHTWSSESSPAVARAQPGPDQIDSLSYTSLSELERCGYRYYLERILGLGENRGATRTGSPREGLEARARGTLVHRLLESVDFARPSAPAAEDVAAAASELGMRIGRGEQQEIVALVGGALPGALAAGAERAAGPASADRRAPAERLARAESVRREHPFAFSLGPREPLVTGVIDMLAREAGGGILVVDYKTDRVGASEDLQALVERDYGVQRLLYALAVLRDGAPKVEIVHWFLQRPQEWVGAAFSMADRSELEGRLTGRIQAARARGFKVSGHPHRGLCETCPGRAGLCSWSDAETLREDHALEGPPAPSEAPSRG